MRLLCSVSFLAGLLAGCGNTTTNTSDSAPPLPNNIGTWKAQQKIDPNTFEPQTCTGPNDAACNWQGPGQRLVCEPDLTCQYYQSDEGCEYQGLAPDSMLCPVVGCGGDDDCSLHNPDPDHLTATCIFTEASLQADPLGLCFFAYASCTALPGTPCEESGVMFCADGACECTATGDMMGASLESCDGVDNDCDGQVDEIFPIGEACDDVDADQCKNGTRTCKADGTGTECVNEDPVNVAELCNGLDDDCDGVVDEDFPTLGQACDGDDVDLCKNGTYMCKADGSSVTCEEVGVNVAETCNGHDDNCDGTVDEGCDDDQDGWCDGSMVVGPGATCTSGDCDDQAASVNPGEDERCNSGIDDDCDGEVDEGFNLGGECSAGQGVCLVKGTYFKCSEDGLSAVCSAETDKTQKLDGEVCNGLDDTCDGKTDEGCDDDQDGFCDGSMLLGAGAACDDALTDCDDTKASVHPGGTESCNGADDDCDGVTDEGCDDDGDGWCDSSMDVTVPSATCQPGDCDDEGGAEVNPGMEEKCSTPFDDNCDGDTEHLADGQTLACDSCANALELDCGVEYEIDMGSEPNASDTIDTYTCWTNVGAKKLKTTFSAPEVIVVPDADPGTQFSLQILTAGTGTIAARLHGSCEPNEDTSEVTAFHPPDFNGTCATYGVTSVGGGVVGEDFVSLDAASAKTLTVKFTCSLP